MKEKTKPVSLRIPPSIIDRVKAMAVNDSRSFNGMVVRILNEAADKSEAK